MALNDTSEKLKDSAKDNLQKAYENILKALQPSTRGSDEWNNQYIDTLHECASQIIKLKRKL